MIVNSTRVKQQLAKTKKALVWDGFIEMAALMEMFFYYMEGNMDKQIRKIEKTIKKDTGKEEKALKSLEKADKKRDKVCEMGKKAMKAKGK